MSGCARALDAERLDRLLRDLPFVQRFVLLERTNSTNEVARQLAAEGAEAGTVVIAEEQTAGRGGRGNAWYSPAGLGLYLSAVLRPGASAAKVTRWTLGSAVAACEACRELSCAEVGIRWPNDLLVGGRKVGGVLAELRTVGGRPKDLVIGLGLNVGHERSDFPDELCSSATSLRLAGGLPIPDRESLAALFLRALGSVSRELESDAWSAVARRWVALAPGAVGQPVDVVPHSGAGGYTGRTRGLDELGALRVQRDDGRVVSVRSVESVRPSSGED